MRSLEWVWSLRSCYGGCGPFVGRFFLRRVALVIGDVFGLWASAGDDGSGEDYVESSNSEDEDEDEEEEDEVVTYLNSDCDSGDDSELEGAVPTAKRRKLASSIGFDKSLKSGSYPNYNKDLHGPYESMDPRSNDPLDFVKLLWPDYLVDLIVEETNRYARNKSKDVRDWKAVDRQEVWTFLGIIVFMSIHRLPRIENYWSKG